MPRVEHKTEKRWIVISEDGWGSFCRETQPLACLYFPRRRPPDDPDPTIEIAPMAQSHAVIELVRHSFAAWLLQTIGLAPQRLSVFGRIAQRVPMRGGFIRPAWHICHASWRRWSMISNDRGPYSGQGSAMPQMPA